VSSANSLETATDHFNKIIYQIITILFISGKVVYVGMNIIKTDWTEKKQANHIKSKKK